MFLKAMSSSLVRLPG